MSPESLAPEGAERVEESREENSASPEQREPASRFLVRERVTPAPDGMATGTHAEDSESHHTGSQIQCPECYHPNGYIASGLVGPLADGCRTLWKPVWGMQALCPQPIHALALRPRDWDPNFKTRGKKKAQDKFRLHFPTTEAE